MDFILLQKLSQNLLEILDDDEYYDITIEVGNDPYVKIFRSHIVILNYRSSYLRRILSTNKKENDGTLVHIKLPNISPEIFQLILRYIYGGKLPLIDYDNLDIIKILVAANELNLQELITHIQSFLIQNKANWMEQNFNLIYQTSFENNSFLELQKYCTDLMSKYPDKILKSLDFSSVPEKILISLIQSDNLQMSEIQVWENVLKWGLAQNPGLSSNPSNYSKDDFNSLKNTLQSCIPFIRFYNLTSQEFSDHILPYKEVLPEELYMDLLKTFLSLNPNSKPGHKSNPRMTKEITPPSPPKPSVSYFNEPPRLSSNPFEAFLNLNSLNPNSNPIHKSNPRMTKEITPPSPPKPSVSYFNEPPRLSSGPFEAFFNPSHKSDSSSPFKEIAPPPPLKPSYSYHKSNPHNAKKIAPPLPLKSSYSNPRNTKKIAPPPPLKSSYSNPRNTKKIAPPPPLKPSYSYSTNDLGIQSPSSSNYNGDLFDSSASIYQKTKMNPWKDVQKSLPVELDQEFSEEYQEKLIHLVNMGFDNEEENLKALKEFNGELDRVIENLLKM